ncbi:MAG: DNA integrity scanning protein DisA nucleotide-binding domain protein [Bacilli bacterium]
MNTIFNQPNANMINVILDFVLAIVVTAGLDYLLFKFVKRTFAVIFTLASEILFLVGFIFEFRFLCCVVGIAFVIAGISFLFANLSEYRTLVANGFKGKSGIDLFPKRSHSPAPEALIDREAVYEKVYTAIIDMSRVKRGALITFEKKDNLLDESKVGTIIKQRGVDVNAPVSAELLETIFYEGTRLHDGAVIIKDDKIARAAVFFTSTARPLTGKYGSRHQAAIGISENSDSVTVIVSEETGRIAIAFQGELTPVTPDNFLRIFEDDMAYDVETNKDGNSGVNSPEGK